MAKPVKAIYLDEDFNFVETDKNPTVVKFPVGIEPAQNMMIWVVNEEGELKPKYQIPANGNDGFPLVYNNKRHVGGIYLDQGQTCRLEFKWNNRFTGTFTIPSKGK